jgi:hypothetical protein
MRGWRLVIAIGATGVLLWLMRTPHPPTVLTPVPDAEAPPVPLASEFDPSRCGTMIGRVEWLGPVPAVEPLPLPKTGDWGGATTFPNPNAPIVHGARLADAVVWLQNVDPARSRAWDHPPVTVEAVLPHLAVRQGDRRGTVGIVRRGTEVSLVSQEARMHSIRGRWATFFTQMLPDPDRPVSRRLPAAGIVELSSGSGYYWMRGYLLVIDHPYAAVTGPDGTFQLDQVPDGEYELVYWKANWNIGRYERDPELVVPVRMQFKEPVERRKRVRVEAGRSVEVTLTLSTADFGATTSGHAP